MVHVKLQLNCPRTYKLAKKELDLIASEDKTLSITMELVDRWAAGQVIVALDLSITSYEIIEF